MQHGCALLNTVCVQSKGDRHACAMQPSPLLAVALHELAIFCCHLPPSIPYKPSAAGHLLLTINGWPSAANHPRLAICCKPSAAAQLLRTICGWPSAANHLRLTFCC